MSKEKALGIALGNINPITGEALAEFSPRKTKVITPGPGARFCKIPKTFLAEKSVSDHFPIQPPLESEDYRRCR